MYKNVLGVQYRKGNRDTEENRETFLRVYMEY